MSLLGAGALVIWNGIAPEAEEDFVAWHVGEHIPERVTLPGFLRGRRYVAEDSVPKYFNFYETGEVADLSSPAYRAALNAPSPWTRRVVAHFADTSRTICAVVASLGRGEGAWIETIRFAASLPPAEFRQSMADALATLARLPGIVGVHLLEGQAEASAGESSEKHLRSQPDQLAAWVMLIEAVGKPAANDARAAANHALERAGAEAVQNGLYYLQYGLTRYELAQSAAAPPGPDRTATDFRTIKEPVR